MCREFCDPKPTYTRIDLFLLKHCDLARMVKATIGSITLSGYAFDLDLSGDVGPPFQWRPYETDSQVRGNMDQELKYWFSSDTGLDSDLEWCEKQIKCK